MSDQLFVGIAPTSPAGEEIFFYSHDDWLALASCILNNLDEDFPLYPNLDSENVIELAKALRHVLGNGVCRDFYDWYALESAGAEDAEEASGRVDRYLMLTQQFIGFLEACGGCRPVFDITNENQ